MYSKSGSITSIYSFVVTSSITAAITAAGVALGAAFGIHAIQKEGFVDVNFDQLTWWRQINLGFEKPEAQNQSPLLAALAPVVEPRLAKISQPSKKIRKPTTRKSKLVAQKTGAVPTRLIETATPAVVDQLGVAQSAVIDEMAQLGAIHLQLQNRFKTIVSSQALPSTAQFASMDTQSNLDPVPSTIQRPVRRHKTAVAKVAMPQIKRPAVNTHEVREPWVAAREVAPLQSMRPQIEKAKKQANLATPPPVVLNSKAAMTEALQYPQNPDHHRVDNAIVAQGGHEGGAQWVDQVGDTGAQYSAAPKPSLDASTSVSNPAPLVNTQSTEYSNGTVIALNQVVSTQAKALPAPEYSKVSSSSLSPSVAADISTQPRKSDQTEPLDKRDISPVSRRTSLMDPSEVLHEASSLSVVEAFRETVSISAFDEQALSYEGPQQTQQSHWAMFSSPQHFSTVMWKSARMGRQTAPLIHHNTVTFLSRMTGVEWQLGTGIVFGKVPAGHAVEFSGRAEKPIYLGPNLQVIAPEQTSLERYFILMNVAPGADLLHLVTAQGHTVAAAVALVSESKATYLDLSQSQTVQIRGRVLDAASASAKGLKGMLVRVVKQNTATAVTDKLGAFTISNIVTFGDQPVFVETESQTGFTHRYKVNALQSGDLQLFYFKEKKVSQWLGQLEGGVSIESGIVVEGFYEKVKINENAPVTASITPMAEGASLIPEIYTLSADDQLLVKTPLEVSPARVLSVHVPKGALLSELRDKTGQVIWSEVVVSSPNVINVIGPY